MIPFTTIAPVVRTDRLGAYHVLWMRAPDIARGVKPGQFVNIAPEPGGSSLLRRPFSVYQVEGENVSIVFDAIGEGTRWLASRRPGDEIDVVGPLGHGFDLPEAPGVDLLIGGGYGSAALSLLSTALAGRGGIAHAIIGARSVERLFQDKVLRARCTSITVLTDDGSAGARGIVTDAVPSLIAEHGVRTVYACGPMRMLEAVARACEGAGVDSQLAVEEFMACGIGVCWTCVLPVQVNAARSYLRSCTEGPVFEGAAIAWA